MKRREFITLLGSVAAAEFWPMLAHAERSGPMRRIGVLMLYAQNDPEGQIRATAFQQGLEKLGWTVGRNLAIDYQWGVGDIAWIRGELAQLLRLAPDVILANGDQAVRAAREAAATVPIVFIGGSDPVAQGYVKSLARPGSNVTGFSVIEPTIGPKWLELLKEIAPHVSRVAVMLNPDNAGSVLLSRWVIEAGPKFAADIVVAPVHGPEEIESFLTMHGREAGGGLILPSDPTTASRRKLIVELAARYRFPAIYGLRAITADGGLMSYGISIPDLFRQAAGYVDRILHGEKPADLPVQQPTKFELVINLKTAKALGLTVSNALLVAADEVIE